MSKTVEELTRDAMSEAMARAIVAELDGPRRDEILTEGIRRGLTGYEFRHAAEKALRDRAATILEARLATGQYDAMILETWEAAVGTLRTALGPAFRAMLVDAICGAEGSSYDTRPGRLLRYLNDEMSRQQIKAKTSPESPDDR